MASIGADVNPIGTMFSAVSLGISTFFAAIYSVVGLVFAALRFIFICALALLDTLARPILWLLSPLIYLLSLLAEALVLKPYRAVTYLGRETRDVWIFFGIALLVGAGVGLCAGRISRAIVGVLLPKKAEARDARRVEAPARMKVEDGSQRVSGKKRVEWAEL